MMSLLKVRTLLFSRGKYLLKSQVSSISTRGIATTKVSQNFEDTAVWAKMSEVERMNCALAESEPRSAKMAFYRGLAFARLGTGYHNDAIAAFEKAVELDKAYSAPSEKQMADIYANLGETKSAFETMKKAYEDLVSTKLDPEQVELLQVNLGINSGIVAFKPSKMV